MRLYKSLLFSICCQTAQILKFDTVFSKALLWKKKKKTFSIINHIFISAPYTTSELMHSCVSVCSTENILNGSVCVCRMLSELNRHENDSDIVCTAPPHCLSGQSLTSSLKSPRLFTLTLLLLHSLVLKE